jgi:molybdopterin molybdotransferase
MIPAGVMDLLERRKPIPIGDAVKKIMEYHLVGKTQYVSIDESYGRFL